MVPSVNFFIPALMSEDVVTTFGLTTVIETKNDEEEEKITNIDAVTKEEMDGGKEVITVIKSDVNDGKKELNQTKQADGKETKTVKSEDDRSSDNKDLGKNKKDGGHDEQKEVANTEASSVKIDSTKPHEIINIEEHKEDVKKETKTKTDEDKKNGTKEEKQDTKSPEKENTKVKGPILDSSATAPTTNGDSLDNLMKTVLDFTGSLPDDGNDLVTEL